jgi:hypothetical protein
VKEEKKEEDGNRRTVLFLHPTVTAIWSPGPFVAFMRLLRGWKYTKNKECLPSGLILPRTDGVGSLKEKQIMNDWTG